MVNIQCTHYDPRIAAMDMDDKRVSKMVLESAQMYCTITGDQTYRPVHQNNPTTRWATSNLGWLIEWHHSLAGEYYFRSGKTHKSFLDVGQYMRGPALRRIPHFRNGARSSRKFPDGREIDFTDIKDPHLAYRYYLRSRMMFDTKQPVWTRRPPPWWLDELNTTDRPMIHSWDVWPRSTRPVKWLVDINDITRKKYGLL